MSANLSVATKLLCGVNRSFFAVWQSHFYHDGERLLYALPSHGFYGPLLILPIPALAF